MVEHGRGPVAAWLAYCRRKAEMASVAAFRKAAEEAKWNAWRETEATTSSLPGPVRELSREEVEEIERQRCGSGGIPAGGKRHG